MTTTVSAVRLAALTMEPEILERVVRFLPMRSSGRAIGDATAVLQTVATICQTLPSDADHIIRHIGPTNRAFWCDMVLQCFDFTVDRDVAFNVEDHSESIGNLDEDDIDEYTQAAMDAWDAANPDCRPGEMLAESLQYWKRLNAFFRPYQYGFLRKIQTGKLTMDAWPEHEDPFTLFCDLAMIKDKFDTFRDVMETDSDGQQFVYPVFLSAFYGSVKQADPFFLRHCGIIPHFWAVRLEPVSQPWHELDVEMDESEEEEGDIEDGDDEVEDEMEEAEAEEGEEGAAEDEEDGSDDDEEDSEDMEEEEEEEQMEEDEEEEQSIKIDDDFAEYHEYEDSSDDEDAEDEEDGEEEDEDDEHEEEQEEETDEDESGQDENDNDSSLSEEDEDEEYLDYDEYPFPYSTRKKLNKLQALVRRYMDDFRCIAVNQEHFAGPTFYIGRLKRSGRWLGFVGQRDY